MERTSGFNLRANVLDWCLSLAGEYAMKAKQLTWRNYPGTSYSSSAAESYQVRCSGDDFIAFLPDRGMQLGKGELSKMKEICEEHNQQIFIEMME